MSYLWNLLDRVLDASLLGYTKVGFKARRKHFGALPRMDGKRIVVTGATSGIGKATVQGLAELGAEVILVARNREKAERVCAQIQAVQAAEAGSSVHHRVELADMSRIAEVRALAQRLLALSVPIHGLVNNAGVLLDRREETDEGHEIAYATNLLSHFLLTERLIPELERSGSGVVVHVSSGGMYAERIDPDDLQSRFRSYEGARVYARTKRAQVILAEMWAESWKHRGVSVHSMHPGWADTQGVRRSLPTFHKITRPLLRTAEEGADTVLFLLATSEPARSTGQFWHDRAPRPAHRFRWTRETKHERTALIRNLKRDAGLATSSLDWLVD
ncbi:MAG: SDR family NAD(P)-dependent oxidoreductase [Myxococcota bacterium]